MQTPCFSARRPLCTLHSDMASTGFSVSLVPVQTVQNLLDNVDTHVPLLQDWLTPLVDFSHWQP